MMAWQITPPKALLTIGLTFLAGAGSAVLFLSRGASARPPGKWETLIVTAAKHHLISGQGHAANPIAANAENIRTGQEVFSYYCFACHGLDGQGTGVPFADAMSPPVPSLAAATVQSYSDGQLYSIIRDGLWPSGMPAARGILDDQDIWSLVLYIRHLPRPGSLGEPPGYGGTVCPQAVDK